MRDKYVILSFSTLIKTAYSEKVNQVYGDEFVSKLLSILHEINTNLNLHLSKNVSGLFLDMSNAFDEV